MERRQRAKLGGRRHRRDQILAPVAEALLAAAALTPGEAVLDFGCGCGATTLAAAQAVGPAGVVLGIDLSELMLGVARRRAEASGLSQLQPVTLTPHPRSRPSTRYRTINGLQRSTPSVPLWPTTQDPTASALADHAGPDGVRVGAASWDDAVRALRRRGHRAVRLEDGFPEWRRAGLPVAVGD
jgi:SAM-dependent methyltransferase